MGRDTAIMLAALLVPAAFSQLVPPAHTGASITEVRQRAMAAGGAALVVGAILAGMARDPAPLGVAGLTAGGLLLVHELAAAAEPESA